MVATQTVRTWRYEDLFDLPDDGRRYEIIEGELFEMPAPSLVHARVVMKLIRLLLPIVERLGGELLTAPLDVFFPGADPVEPDIVVLLPGGTAVGVGRGIEGPPDLVIEAISPSNRAHDDLTKRALYARGGVREYWLVDPAAGTIEVMTLDRDAYHAGAVSAGEAVVASPLLPAVAFPAAAVFADIER